MCKIKAKYLNIGNKFIYENEPYMILEKGRKWLMCKNLKIKEIRYVSTEIEVEMGLASFYKEGDVLIVTPQMKKYLETEFVCHRLADGIYRITNK